MSSNFARQIGVRILERTDQYDPEEVRRIGNWTPAFDSSRYRLPLPRTDPPPSSQEEEKKEDGPSGRARTPHNRPPAQTTPNGPNGG
jgi:hypothetical protein